MLTKYGDMSLLTEANTQNEAGEATFSVTAPPKMVPKISQTFRVVASNLGEVVKPTIYIPIPATKLARTTLNSIINILSLTTQPLAIPTGFLLTQPHSTVNSSTFSA